MREPTDEALLAARLAWHEDARRWARHPDGIAFLARDLCALERAWRTHIEHCCNGDLSEVTEERADARLRKRVAAWCARVPGAIVELEGDPRGAVLRLKLPMTEAVAV